MGIQGSFQRSRSVEATSVVTAIGVIIVIGIGGIGVRGTRSLLADARALHRWHHRAELAMRGRGGNAPTAVDEMVHGIVHAADVSVDALRRLARAVVVTPRTPPVVLVSADTSSDRFVAVADGGVSPVDETGVQRSSGHRDLLDVRSEATRNPPRRLRRAIDSWLVVAGVAMLGVWVLQALLARFGFGPRRARPVHSMSLAEGNSAMQKGWSRGKAIAQLRDQVGLMHLTRAVANVTNEAPRVEDAIGATLQLVCRHMNWPVGHAVFVARSGPESSERSLWHLQGGERFAEIARSGDVPRTGGDGGCSGRQWQSEPSWAVVTATSSPYRSAALASGLHGVLTIPVMVETAVVARLEFLCEDEARPPEHVVDALAGIGMQLGRVIERVDADARLREYTERLETLSRRLLAAQEQERRHVAHELHDEIGQSLTALKLDLQALEEAGEEQRRDLLAESVALAEVTLQQTRDLSRALRPAIFDDLGLVPAVRWYLDRQGSRAGFTTELSADTLGDEVPEDIAITCFRIVQEALTNVARHAKASHVVVRLVRRSDRLDLVVRDDGRGFDLADVLARGAHESLGLIGMRERATLVGGTLHVHSEPGGGTTIHVELPLRTGALAEPSSPVRRIA